jgi:hypothetical protein
MLASPQPHVPRTRERLLHPLLVQLSKVRHRGNQHRAGSLMDPISSHGINLTLELLCYTDMDATIKDDPPTSQILQLWLHLLPCGFLPFKPCGSLIQIVDQLALTRWWFEQKVADLGSRPFEF